MALVTTVADTTQDSYATEAEADAIVAWRNSDAWTNATSATKEGVLKEAAKIMDTFYYKGAKSDRDQGLRFPSGGMNNSSGTLYIPERIKRAQSYLALHLLEDPDIMAGSTGAKSVTIAGTATVNYGDGGGAGRDLPEDVKAELDPWLWKHGPTPGRVWDPVRRVVT